MQSLLIYEYVHRVTVFGVLLHFMPHNKECLSCLHRANVVLLLAARRDDLMYWFSELAGGPLSSKYRLEQFHMHWGDCNNEGSEHTVDGQSFAGEVGNPLCTRFGSGSIPFAAGLPALIP